MKLGIKLIAWLTALLCLMSCVSVFPIGALSEATLMEGDSAPVTFADPNSDGSATKKKIVSVMYDNSGSMTSSDNRNGYARYALRMLMALLGKDDELVIIPMNRYKTDNVDNGYVENDGTQYPLQRIEVDLANDNRQQVITDVLNHKLLSPVLGAGTPHTPIADAVDSLASGGTGNETDEGLKDQQHLNESNPSVEHWLIIITDGAFNGCTNSSGTADPVKVANAIESNYILNYPSLNTIYFGMGKSAAGLENQDINTKYKFNSFKAGTADTIVSEMQKIANLLTGRYTLDPSCYSFPGNASSGTVLTIDLKDVGFSLKNISVIAQNCGAQLVKYQHNNSGMNISNACVITSELTGVNNGYSAVLDVSPGFMNGTVVLEFDKAVSKSNISILAEPAFRLESFYEYKDGSSWKSITMEQINADLSEGSVIRVGYKVYDQSSGKEVDLTNSTIFGSFSGQVTYANKTYTARYTYGSNVVAAGECITLKEGNNDVGLSVSIMDDSFIMKQSSTLSISGVIISGEYSEFGYNTSKPNEAKAVFSAKDKLGKAVSINNSNYTWSVKVLGPTGTQISNYTSSANSGGDKITVTVTAPETAHGDYTVIFKVKSNSSGTERTVTKVMSYDFVAPPVLTIQKVDAPSSFSSGGAATVKFNLKADNSKVTSFADYKLTAKITTPDNKTVDATPKTDSSGNITVGMNAIAGMFGEYKVELYAVYKSGTPQEATASSTHKIDYSYSSSDPNAPKIVLEKEGFSDNFGSNGNASWKYKVYVNGVQLTKAEIESNFTVTLSAKDPRGSAADFKSSVGNDGTVTVTLTAANKVYGEYPASFEIKSKYNASFKATDEVVVKYLPGGGGGSSLLDIEATGFTGSCDANGKAEWKYYISINSSNLTKAELADYTWTVAATAPDGSKAQINATLESDGAIKITLSAASKAYGDYNVTFEIASKYVADLKGSDECDVKYLPGGGAGGDGSDDSPLVIEKIDFTGSCESNKKAEWSYKLVLDGNQLTKSDLASYTWSVNAKAPDGSDADIVATLSDSGIITVVLTATDAVYGDYEVVLDVKHNFAPDDINAQDTSNVSYKLFDVEIKENHGNVITTDDLNGKLEYKIYIEGNQLNDSDLAGYDIVLKVIGPGDKEIATVPQIGASGTISAIVAATARDFGHYTIEFTITSKTDPNMTATSSHSMTYHPSSVVIDSKVIGEIGNGITSVNMEHTIIVEGVQMNAAELNKFSWALDALDPNGNRADIQISVDDDGKISSAMDVSSTGFGLYKAKLAINFCGNVSDGATDSNADCYEEKTDDLKFYPENVDIKVIIGSTSISEYELTQNESVVIKFELYADDVPFAWNNGLTEFVLKVAGKDVSDVALIEGNVLTYAPHSKDLGELTVNEYELSVEVSCSDAPNLVDKETGKLTVTKTLYEVITVDLGGKTVDRFDLKNLDAALYFQVLRDGKALSIDELKAAWDSGDIGLKDEKGVFGWQFWLPCGSETTVEEIDGNPVIVFKVTKDWIAPFDTFVAMLMFNGDKPVTVTYKDAVGTDAITFTPSGAWSYIWRILVILFVIHTILYIIGFFNGKCKNHMKGMIVSAMIGSDTGKITFKVSKKINVNIKDVIAWHALRFIPNKHGYLWYHQPMKDGPSPSRIGYDEKGNFGIFFKNNSVYRINTMIDSEFVDAISEMKTKLRKYKGKGATPTVKDFKGYEVREALGKEFDAEPIPKMTRVDAGSYYGRYDSTGKLVGVIFFVRNN